MHNCMKTAKLHENGKTASKSQNCIKNDQVMRRPPEGLKQHRQGSSPCPLSRCRPCRTRPSRQGVRYAATRPLTASAVARPGHQSARKRTAGGRRPEPQNHRHPEKTGPTPGPAPGPGLTPTSRTHTGSKAGHEQILIRRQQRDRVLQHSRQLRPAKLDTKIACHEHIGLKPRASVLAGPLGTSRIQRRPTHRRAITQ